MALEVTIELVVVRLRITNNVEAIAASYKVGMRINNESMEAAG
jgi:hypothetical protein